jgi:hypothetical protein
MLYDKEKETITTTTTTITTNQIKINNQQTINV